MGHYDVINMPHLVFGSEPQWSVFQGSGSTFFFSVTRRNVKSVWLLNDYKCLRRCALVTWMWSVKSCSCSRGFFSGHSPRPVCVRVQRILKKLPRTTSFEPRQTLLPTMRERGSMFWSLSSWILFFVYLSSLWYHPRGEGGKLPYEKVGFARHLA